MTRFDSPAVGERAPSSSPARDPVTGRWLLSDVMKRPAVQELLAGLSLSEWCTRTEVPRESLHRWAHGRGWPRIGSLAQIALGTGKSIAEVRAIMSRVARGE